MGGGLMELTATGAEDLYLIGNPQITFFKSVYRKYTNFAIEYISQELSGPLTLSQTTITSYKCKINRNADLLSNMYLTFQIPNIFSSSVSDNVVDSSSGIQVNQKFRWVKNLGSNIIHSIKFILGNQTIETITGEWINIWSELNISADKKYSYNEMIGNVPEVYDPSSAPGNNGYYPASSLDPEKTSDPEDYTGDIDPYRSPPSILAREIIVPIPFWFCTHPGLSLPLVALQYSDIELEVQLNPLIDLYTIIETNSLNKNYGQYVKPNPLRSDQNISNFISETLGTSDYSLLYETDINKLEQYKIAFKDITAGKLSQSNWNIDLRVDCGYIYLEEDERKRFAKVTHEYLIQTPQYISHLGVIGNNILDIDAKHPIKEIIIATNRGDRSSRNDWSNYSNWIFEDIAPWSIGNSNFKNSIKNAKDKSESNWRIELANKNSLEFPNKGNMKYFEKNIIKNMSLLFNGVHRQSVRNHEFYGLLQPFYYSNVSPKCGIYVYSFSLKDSADFQPKGACNFSRLKSCQLSIELIDAPFNKENNSYSYKYDINIYLIGYNILRIMGGMGNLAFSN
jgi:hypothetical protein